MNKFIYLLLISILSVVIVSCDQISMDTIEDNDTLHNQNHNTSKRSSVNYSLATYYFSIYDTTEMTVLIKWNDTTSGNLDVDSIYKIQHTDTITSPSYTGGYYNVAHTEDGIYLKDSRSNTSYYGLQNEFSVGTAYLSNGYTTAIPDDDDVAAFTVPWGLIAWTAKQLATKDVICTNGGIGSSKCTGTFGKLSCSATCDPGWYACCNLTCKCIKYN
jgi:hypothetical protein